MVQGRVLEGTGGGRQEGANGTAGTGRVGAWCRAVEGGLCVDQGSGLSGLNKGPFTRQLLARHRPLMQRGESITEWVGGIMAGEETAGQELVHDVVMRVVGCKAETRHVGEGVAGRRMGLGVHAAQGAAGAGVAGRGVGLGPREGGVNAGLVGLSLAAQAALGAAEGAEV